MHSENRERKENFFTRLYAKIKNMLLTVLHGSLATKLSCCFMGVGQIMRGQIVKGIVYAVLEILFVLFMVFFGGEYIGRFVFSGHLGTVTEGSYWNDELGIYETVQ